MKVYYKGVLLRNWLKVAKFSKKLSQRKATDFQRSRLQKRVFSRIRWNFLENRKKVQFFSTIFSKIAVFLKRKSFKALKLETKFKQL